MHNARVLVTNPGSSVIRLVYDLIEQGVQVTVETAEPDRTLADVVSRQLISVVTKADASAYDLVLRDSGEWHRPCGIQRDCGRVTLVGGGPGPSGLLTRAGFDAIARADVIVCDRLVPLGCLSAARTDAEIVYVGKMPHGEFTPQETINATLVEYALRDKHVVRLKGGDGFVFGRGGEEWIACKVNGIDVEVIPGVTSSVAVPALAGIPLTHRGMTQGFVVVSGHVEPDDPRSEVNWAAIAHSGLTVVVLMGVATVGAITAALITHGMADDTPAAAISDGGLPSMRLVSSTVTGLADGIAVAELRAPAVLVIGPVVHALQSSPGDNL